MDDKDEAEIKIESDDGGGVILPDVLLQYTALTPEQVNNVCNFAIDPTREIRLPYCVSKIRNSKDPQDDQVNYGIAVTFVCPSCGVEFEKQNAWKQHLNEVHEYNTPRGINFVQIDKLYYRCLECNKAIAKYAMENLLIHKFLHLPHPSTKCKICHRRYKYRHILIEHLRLLHRVEVLSMMARAKNKTSHNTLQIKDVKGNAVDLFANTCDSVEVKNEPLDPDYTDDEKWLEPFVGKSELGVTSFMGDVRSQSSLQFSDQRQSGNDSANGKECIKYIQYICPACGLEFPLKNEWLEHVQEFHNFCNIKGLGFQQRNNATVECKECKRVMPDKSMEDLQSHKFTHLSDKTWMRCKLCCQNFSDIKNITNHLRYQHQLDNEYDVKFVDDNNDATLLDPHSVETNDNKDVISYEIKFLNEDNDCTFPKDDTSKSYDDRGSEKIEEGDIFVTRTKRLKCTNCYSTFSTTKALQNHTRELHCLEKPPLQAQALRLSLKDVRSCNRAVEHKSISYHCPQCNELFSTHTLWRLHIGAAHDLSNWKGLNFRQLCEKIYVCLECHKRVVTNTRSIISQLQWHKLLHLPYKSFSCVECNKFYSHKQLFFKHLNPDNKCPMECSDHLSKINKSREKSSTQDSTMGLVRAISAYIGNPSSETQ